MDGPRDALGQPEGGVVLDRSGTGVVPRRHGVIVGAFDQGPEIDASGHRVVEGEVAHAVAEGRVVAEDGIDQFQDRGGRAEGVEKFALFHAAGVCHLVAEGFPAKVETGGVGALEAVDGLFLVADDEERAVAIGLARNDFADQRLNDVPLRRTGVLGIVHQHVVDAFVEAEKHPLQRAVAEKRAGPGDEVVEVEYTEVGFDAGV